MRYWLVFLLALLMTIGVGEATLGVCPRCALYAQLLGVLESRVQGAQLGLF
jgi:hypothetical protein